MMKFKFLRIKANFNFRRILSDYLLFTVGSILLAINFDIFLAPHNIAPGGVSGAAIILQEYIG